jgi:hypothetical protein
MKPHIERLQKAGYSIEMVDIDESPTLAESAEVRGVPTTAIYEDGVLVERVVGYEDVDRLKKELISITNHIDFQHRKKQRSRYSMKYKVIVDYYTTDGTLYKEEIVREDNNSTLEGHIRVKDNMGKLWFVPKKNVKKNVVFS